MFVEASHIVLSLLLLPITPVIHSEVGLDFDN